MAEMTPANLRDQEIERVVQQAVAAMRRGDLAAAFAIAEKEIAAGAEHPFLIKVKALWLHNDGQFQEALKTFHHARTLTPDDPSILNGIAGSLAGMGEYDAALRIVDASLELAPDSSPTHYLRGWILEAARDYPAARTSYERAVSLSPTHVQALAGLASVAVRLDDFVSARARATQALALAPQQPTATVALAMAEAEQGNASLAEDRIRNLLKTRAKLPFRARALAWGVLGDALDAQDRTEEAFAAYREKADEFRRHYAAATAGSLTTADILAPLASRLDALPAETWARREMPNPIEGEPRTHVFLLGFLRSGTTLLEQVLAIHPNVVSLDERGCLKDLAREFLQTPEGLDRLAALEGQALDNARASHWRRVSEHGIDPKGKVFVDKEPLNTVNLPLIAKLFPDAKVLFALRDPRDVVFSCYRRQFDIDPSKLEFLTLEDCARFYAAVMNLGEISRAKLPLKLHEHRYERMVEDFDGRVQAMCDFVGLEWTDAMRDFSERARARTIRSTLSATQVRRQLYSEGVDQWRRYEKQLAPMLPILAPWVQKFGYPQP
ncbi:MAG: sulfotransferase [Rhizomicrobium sp.]